MYKTENIIKIFEAPKVDFSPLPTAVIPQNLVWRPQLARINPSRVPKGPQGNKYLQKPPSKDLLGTSWLKGKAQSFPT